MPNGSWLLVTTIVGGRNQISSHAGSWTVELNLYARQAHHLLPNQEVELTVIFAMNRTCQTLFLGVYKTEQK
jgi:hypothetical protein